MLFFGRTTAIADSVHHGVNKRVIEVVGKKMLKAGDIDRCTNGKIGRVMMDCVLRGSKG